MNKNSLNTKLSLPIGSVMIIVLLGLYKCWHLAPDLATGWQDVFLQLWVADTFMIGIMLGASTLVALARGKFAKTITFLLLLGLTFTYAIDSILVVLLNERLSIFDVWRYLPEWRIALDVISLVEVLLLLAILPCLFLSLAVSYRILQTTIGFSLVILCLGIVGIVSAPTPLHQYTVPIFAETVSLFKSFKKRKGYLYTEDETKFYTSDFLDYHKIQLLPNNPNIILVIVESLSSRNSKKTSGLHDRMTEFDSLSSKGLLFSNVLANHYSSEGGIVSLLSAVPPLHFPSASSLPFREYGNLPAVPEQLEKVGYKTEFLTTTELKFLELDKYVKGLGFDYYRGRDEVREFREAPQIVQYSPSDDFLYTEALKRVQHYHDRNEKFFLTLVTASSHLKYTHPYDGEDTPEAVWKWVGQQIVHLHDSLSKQMFFDDGVLVVIGDHRVMKPVHADETQRYGDSAQTRIPLLLIGKGIPSGRIDNRFLQASDLFLRTADLLNPKKPLSPFSIWVDRYTAAWGRVSNAGNLTFFSPSDNGQKGWDAYVTGRTFLWKDGKPANWRLIEARVHQQRAAHQKLRASLNEMSSFRCPENQPSAELHSKPSSGLLQTNTRVQEQPETVSFSRIVSEVNFSNRTQLAIKQPGATKVRFTGLLNIENAGPYWFRIKTDTNACMYLDEELFIEQPTHQRYSKEMHASLDKGVHPFTLEIYAEKGQGQVKLEWILPEKRHWDWVTVPKEHWGHSNASPSNSKSTDSPRALAR